MGAVLADDAVRLGELCTQFLEERGLSCGHVELREITMGHIRSRRVSWGNEESHELTKQYVR